MGALSIVLRTGEDLPLASPVLAEEMIAAKPRLKRLKQLLKERFKGRGMKVAEADAAATSEIQKFLMVVLGELGDAYVDGKTAVLKRLVALHEEVQAMYRDVLRGRGEVKLDLDALHGKYREMQSLFDELGKPVKTVAEDAAKPRTEAAANAIVIEPTKVKVGTPEVVTPEVRFDSLEGRPGWSRIEDGAKRRVGMRANLKGGVVEVRIENGRIVVTSKPTGQPAVTFGEFDTLPAPYSKKPLSTRVVQAHHGCQNALMLEMFEDFGYHGDDAPTIWLRDSTGDSPHGVITHGMQNPNEAARMQSKPTYGQIRDFAVADLKAANAPDVSIQAYLKEMDAYFERAVAPKLRAAGLDAKIGTIKAY